MKTGMLLLCGFLLLSGCNVKINEGAIIAKRHEEPRKWIQMVGVPYRVGMITSIAQVPFYFHDDEDWIITIQTTQNRKVRHREIYVSPEIYEAYMIGDWFVLSDGMETEDPIHKTRK